MRRVNFPKCQRNIHKEAHDREVAAGDAESSNHTPEAVCMPKPTKNATAKHCHADGRAVVCSAIKALAGMHNTQTANCRTRKGISGREAVQLKPRNLNTTTKASRSRLCDGWA